MKEKNYQISNIIIKTKIINWIFILLVGLLALNIKLISGIRIILFCLNYPILIFLIRKLDFYDEFTEKIFFCSAARVILSFTAIISLVKIPEMVIVVLALIEMISFIWEGYNFKNNLFLFFSLSMSLISLVIGIYVQDFLPHLILATLIILYIINKKFMV